MGLFSGLVAGGQAGSPGLISSQFSYTPCLQRHASNAHQQGQKGHFLRFSQTPVAFHVGHVQSRRVPSQGALTGLVPDVVALRRLREDKNCLHLHLLSRMNMAIVATIGMSERQHAVRLTPASVARMQADGPAMTAHSLQKNGVFVSVCGRDGKRGTASKPYRAIYSV